MNRKEAKQSNQTKYHGKICEKHPELKGLRWVTRSICVRCATEKTLLKRKNNPDKIRAERKRYKLKHRDEILKKEKKRRERDSKTILGVMRCRYQDARCRATKRNLEFSITVDDLIQTHQLQNGLCSLSKMKLIPKAEKGKSISVDRIDSSKGYTKDNIRLLLHCVNAGLMNMEDNDLRKICELILNPRQEIGEMTPRLRMYINSKLQRRNVDLDRDIMIDLLEKQQYVCAITGVTFYSIDKLGYSASLDRIDPNKGYKPGNIRFVLNSVNCLKHVLDDEWLKCVAAQIVCQS